MVQGGAKCAKYCLFLVNLLFVLAGIVLLVVGVMSKNGINRFGDLVESSKLNAPANLFIVVGAVVFIIAFLGCCGAVKENHCMMMTYSVLIGLILILEVGAAVTAYYMEDDVKDILGNELSESLKKYGNNNEEDLRKSWDLLHHTIKCCGVNNYTDWFNVKNETTQLFILPTSCCLEDTANCTESIKPDSKPEDVYKFLFNEGCVQKGLEEIHMGSIGTVGISLAVVELLAIISSCFMARKIRFSYETV